MAVYKYSGIKAGKKKTRGFVAAHTDKEAERNVERLAVRNIKIKKIIPTLGGAEFVLFKDVSANKLSKKNQAYFFEQLSFLLKSGLTLFQCIDTMSQSSNEEIAKLAVRLKPSIVSGLSIDEAMKKTGLFTYDTIAKIAAGRASGSITETLDLLSKKLKEEVELKAKIVGSLTYPLFMVFMLIAVLIIMLAFVIPSIGETIANLGGEMPKLTTMLISASNFVVKYGLWIALGLLALLGAHIYFMKNIRKYRYIFHSFRYKLPVIGSLIMKINIQSMSSTLSQLLSSGVTIANALMICTKTVPNLRMQEAIQKAYVKVAKEGYDVYSAIESTNFFPPDFVQMVMIGSKSGNLEGVLDSIDNQYAMEVQETLKRMTAMIEPIAIVATAIVGGICVIAMYLPMFNVFQSI
jgi:type IV pilus assembly protein PilC